MKSTTETATPASHDSVERDELIRAAAEVCKGWSDGFNYACMEPLIQRLRSALLSTDAKPVVDGELPPLPEGKAVVRGPVSAFNDPEYGTLVDFDCEGPLSHDPEDGEELFTADQMRDYVRAAMLAATPAREWIDDENRLKWALWRISELESKLREKNAGGVK